MINLNIPDLLDIVNEKVGEHSNVDVSHVAECDQLLAGLPRLIVGSLMIKICIDNPSPKIQSQ